MTTFANYLRLVRDKVTEAGICSAMQRMPAERYYHEHRQRLNEHIWTILGHYECSYLCTAAGIAMGSAHPLYDDLMTSTHPFGKFFRVHWLNLAIEEVAHNDNNPLPPFFTAKQLEELYEQFLQEHP